MRPTKVVAGRVHCAWIFVIGMAAATFALAAPPAALTKGAKYVSLGSSFAAGPGIPAQQASCGRSDHNYPHLVAAALGLTLTDVSCSGATTGNILDTPQGEAVPQIAALTSDTVLVTVTIGGNDISYSGSTIKCGGAKVEEHCAANLDQAAIAESVKRLPARLGDVLTAIRAKAPKAIIVVVPYPRVIPSEGQRCAELGLATDDANYFAALGEQLEKALVSAATTEHALVADAYVRSAGHGPCADAANRWVNGAKPAGSGAAFHPTANGHSEMARLVLAALGAAQVADTRIVESAFGKMPNGVVVKQFTLRNHKGMTVKVINYGAIITAITVPDNKGMAANVILGSDSLDDYLGRFSAAAVQGRYANRIAKGHFILDGTEYQVTRNIGEHHLHGGTRGFAKVVWEATPLPEREHEVGVHLSYLSVDGEEGYPGNLRAGVTYTLTDDNELRLDYTASTDKPTVVNLTNHAYFDLSATGKISDQVLWINADTYTLADSQLIPTGEIAPVKNTALDFTTAASIGSRSALIDAPTPQRQTFDHNFVINGGGSQLVKAAEVRDPMSGRVMQVLTTQPGLQLYTGNPLGFALETHHFPDSPNHPQFPSTTVRPGMPFASTTIYKF